MKQIWVLWLMLGCALEAGAQYRFDTVLYGAAYYHEYMPSERLDEDIRLMKEAGVNMVRVGESTWALFEPQEGNFQFAWMDRILDKMHAAGIKVVLGTPTYSIPAWLAERYPEILAVRADGSKQGYGIRQNMDITNASYLFYCERIIRKMMEHFASHPAIIGYQVDNETHYNGETNHAVFVDFRNFVKERFGGDLEKLNKEWGGNYWGMNINSWEEFPRMDGITNPSMKLEWERFKRHRIAWFLNWQADLVKAYKRADQFVTHCFMPSFQDIDQVESFKQMEYPAINVYHNVQDNQDGQAIARAGDFMRSIQRGGNYLVTETNAQAQGWDAKGQYPPYDNQLRQNMYSHLASGANMVGYWHWHTLHYGQETYWKGVLGHDLAPNRIYGEVQRAASELKKIGSKLVNLKKRNQVAILYSHDSYFGLQFMPYKNGDMYDLGIHNALYRMNLETDFMPVDKWENLSDYAMVVIPPLYVASDSLLEKIARYVENGGHAVMFFKSGYTNEYNAVRPVRAPGPLRKVVGASYQEVSTINRLSLKEDPFGVANGNRVSDIAEMLIPEGAKVLATYDHPFFGQWAAITQNRFGKGTMTYIGTNPSFEIMQKIFSEVAQTAGISNQTGGLSFPLIVRSGKNGEGKTIRYVFNYSSANQNFNYPFSGGKELLSGKSIAKNGNTSIAPWDLLIVEE